MTTNESKHTPGPWTAAGLHTYAGKVKIAAPLDEDSTELYGDIIADPRHDYPSRDEAEANARLIAAAPDLLAACETILLRWELEPPEKTFPAHALRPMLTAAIAKAKGGVK